MANKKEKILFTLAAAAGIGVTTFLFLKYRKNLLLQINNAKNVFMHDIIKSPRKFDVHIINNADECRRIMEIIREHTSRYCVIGFDCEWVTVNSERKKVALLQLATAEGLTALFRLCKMNSIPIELKSILEDPDVIKTGVACNEDGANLFQDYSIKLRGAFDLRFLALLASHKAEGLGKLSKKILNIELNKNWKITCSDWEIPKLSDEQIDYAAKDAYVAIEIFKNLYTIVKGNVTDKRSILQFCDNYTDISFKNKLAQLNLEKGDHEVREKKLLSYSKNQKDINKVLKRAYTTRNKPLYDNCFLEAPDGALLCTIDKGKANWYLEKKLGVKVEDEPLRVRLNFEPAGRAVGEVGEYYQSVKENLCVVCGKDHDLIRKNVVPHEYRKYFPNIMKDKTSHDVLLLCTRCHHTSNISDLSIRKMLEKKCDAPLLQVPENDDELRRFKLIQKSARALVKSGNLIPEARRNELKAIVKEAHPNEEINDEFLKKISAIKEPKPVQKTSHGEKVVDYYRNNGGIIELEKIYREHFLNTMQPKHLPKLWNVNHNANRLSIRFQENRITPEELKMVGIIPSVQVTSPRNNTDSSRNSDRTNDEADSISVSSFYSAAGTVDDSYKKVAANDDEKYFSDSTIGSYYESCANSLHDATEFKSFGDSSTEKIDNYSDSSTIGSDHDLSDFSQEDINGSDTEVEENL